MRGQGVIWTLPRPGLVGVRDADEGPKRGYHLNSSAAKQALRRKGVASSFEACGVLVKVVQNRVPADVPSIGGPGSERGTRSQ